jgi:hypothetical protein
MRPGMTKTIEISEGEGAETELTPNALSEFDMLVRQRPLQLLTLTALLGTVVWRAMVLKYCVADLDIWWHLKVGDWIIEHRWVPRTGIFSNTAANRPWVAYSWGYEVLLSRSYSWFGLMGVGLFGVVLTVAVAYTVFWMLHRLSGRFWTACFLGSITGSAFLFTLMPRPVFLSMVLFMITLTLILEVRRQGEIRRLYWLPLLFVVWANLHIQFIYGLFLVGLLLVVNSAQELASSKGIAPRWASGAALPSKPLAAIFAGCMLAGCVGPYSYHLYAVVYEYSKAQVPYSMIRELQPINFRFACHYIQLLLTAAAFFAVGRQKRVDLFKLALLSVASVVAYRTMRDSWFICIPAAACIADAFWNRNEVSRREKWFEKLALIAGVAILAVLFARNTDFNTRGLDAAMSTQFPVRAANFLRQNPTPGPLYNAFDWGGFLIWYMPNYPVAIDGRNDLYGDEIDLRFLKTGSGEPSYTTDPYLNEAGTVLLQKTQPLATVLSSDPRFKIAYQDDMAIVFVRE